MGEMLRVLFYELSIALSKVLDVPFCYCARDC
jgi:hypothetical protein